MVAWPSAAAPATRGSRASTPEEDARQMERARQLAATCKHWRQGVFRTIETPHFVIFHDWEPSEGDFLKQETEAAYSCIARFFEIPVSENVFVGKLALYMFSARKDFFDFTRNVARIDVKEDVDLLGYYNPGVRHRLSFIAMWKPGDAVERRSKLKWGYVFAHELSHAFVARHRGSGRLPDWLNEGLAEMTAHTVLPDLATMARAKKVASQVSSIRPIFAEGDMKDARWYPVMETAVRMLSKDRGKFLEMFDLIKAGTPGEEALRQIYGMDYGQLEAAWFKYVKSGG